MSLHSSRVMFIKQIQIETRNKGGLLVLLAAVVATYIYCGYQSQLGMTQKAEKGQYQHTKKPKKRSGNLYFLLIDTISDCRSKSIHNTVIHIIFPTQQTSQSQVGIIIIIQHLLRKVLYIHFLIRDVVTCGVSIIPYPRLQYYAGGL